MNAAPGPAPALRRALRVAWQIWKISKMSLLACLSFGCFAEYGPSQAVALPTMGDSCQPWRRLGMLLQFALTVLFVLIQFDLLYVVNKIVYRMLARIFDVLIFITGRR